MTASPNRIASARGIVLGAATALFASLVLLTTSCSGSAPQILYPDVQLFLQRELTTGETFETLRLFVAIRDDDGVDDLRTLFVIHDESENHWEIDSEQWVTREQGGDSWIGIPDVRMADHLPLPRGRYRIVVEDGALQAAESSFVVTAPSLPEDTVFPALLNEGNSWRVTSAEPVILRVYARTGQQLTSREIDPGPIDSSVILELPNESGLTAYLWTKENQPVRLLIGPFDIER
jgi:hypothetical protein